MCRYREGGYQALVCLKRAKRRKGLVKTKPAAGMELRLSWVEVLSMCMCAVGRADLAWGSAPLNEI